MPSTDEKTLEQKKEDYCRFVESISPKTSILKSLSLAFVFGGLICCIGQMVTDLLVRFVPNMTLDNAKVWTLVALIFLAVLFTGLGFYDHICRYAGAGLFLPITGFANSIASAALEFKTEGLIFGLGTKMFVVAGPVIVNGIVFSWVAAIIHLLIEMIW